MVILGFYKTLAWELLVLIVYVTPCLYWKAGDELSDNYVIKPAMNDKYAKPPIDYLKVIWNIMGSAGRKFVIGRP